MFSIALILFSAATVTAVLVGVAALRPRSASVARHDSDELDARARRSGL